MLNYLLNDYPRIKNKQPNKDAGFADYNWGVGHFFMRETEDDDHISFCVAPVLFKPDETNPHHTFVLDPFDPNCMYKYTYGVNSAIPPADDDGEIYDMGEMWP
jgi:hypothetical protein